MKKNKVIFGQIVTEFIPQETVMYKGMSMSKIQEERK